MLLRGVAAGSCEHELLKPWVGFSVASSPTPASMHLGTTLDVRRSVPSGGLDIWSGQATLRRMSRTGAPMMYGVYVFSSCHDQRRTTRKCGDHLPGCFFPTGARRSSRELPQWS